MNNNSCLIGSVYGRLTVIREGEPHITKTGKKYKTLLCKCSCGNYKSVEKSNLRRGATKSCGCLHKELSSKRLKGKQTGVVFEEGVASFNILFKRYKYGASRRGREFSLTKSEFKSLTKQNCIYCGTIPSQTIQGKRTNGSYIYNGIDRVDNSIGYHYKNCVPCCRTCNFAKKDSTHEEFINWINNLVKFKIGGAE